MVVKTNMEECNTLKPLSIEQWSYSFHNINTSMFTLMFHTHMKQQTRYMPKNVITYRV